MKSIRAGHQLRLQNYCAICLRGLGRLTEALEPMRAGLTCEVNQSDWINATIRASNLSELELTLGEVAEALDYGEQSVTYVDRSGKVGWKTGWKIIVRTTLADAFHQAGRPAKAATHFRDAEQMQAKNQPEYPLLYSVQGFRYCDFLLAALERAAWREMQNEECRMKKGKLVEACRAVLHRAAQTLKWAEQHLGLLDNALDHLTLGRAALYRAILERSSLDTCHSSLSSSAASLRRSGNMDDLPRALLTYAWLRFCAGARTGSESAQTNLDEAWDIAERGPMRLYMADIHLYRARLFFREKPYPWRSPQADLAAAEKLINDCGYHRRDEELADAKRAILGTT